MQGTLYRLIAAAAFTCSSFAAAQQAPLTAPAPLQFIVNGAITEGGDDLVKVKFKNAESEKIKAGGLLMLGGGVLLTPGSGAVSLQLTLNYHFDSITAKNGDASFDRFPLEAIVFVNNGRHRFGAGVSHHLSPEADFDFDNQPKDSAEFDDATGLVVEYDYSITSAVRIGLRYTAIEYEASDFVGEKVDGDHVGLTASLAF